MRIRLMLIILTAALAAVISAPARADRAAAQKALLDVIPADAWGFLAIPSLENLDAKIAMLNKQLGVNLPPVGQMGAAQLGLGEELNLDGGLAVVALDYGKFGQNGPQNSLALLMPANNPDAMIKKLSASGGDDDEDDDGPGTPGAAGADDITKCQIMGNPVFASTRGKFVVIALGKDSCLAITKSKKSLAEAIEKQRLDAFAKSDVILSLAAGSWLKQFEDQIRGFTSMMAMMAGPQGAQATQGIDEMVKMGGQLGSLDLCVAISENGVGLVGLGTPKTGSELAGSLKARKPQAESFLRHLPLEKFAVTIGMLGQDQDKTDAKDVQQAIEQMLSQVGVKEKVDPAKLKEYVDEAVAVGKLFGDTALSVNVLPEGADGIVNASVVMQCKDPDDAIKRMGKLVVLAKGLSDDEEFKKVAAAVEHKSAAETIGGAKVDTIVVDLKKLSDQVEPEDAESIRKIVGKEGLTLRFGPAGKGQLIVSLGGGKTSFERLIKAAESSSGGLNDDAGIVRVAKNLPSKKTGEFYLAVDALMDGIQRIMTAVGEEEGVPFKLGKINAPLAGATTVDATSGRLDIFVPMSLITSVKDAVLAAQAGDEEEDEEEAEDEPAAKPKKPAAGKQSAEDSDDDE